MKTFGAVREEIKKSKRKKMPKIRLNLFIIRDRYFDTNHFMVRLFHGLFWGQPIDSAGGGGGLAVFVNKINNLATQSWKKILAFAS